MLFYLCCSVICQIYNDLVDLIVLSVSVFNFIAVQFWITPPPHTHTRSLPHWLSYCVVVKSGTCLLLIYTKLTLLGIIVSEKFSTHLDEKVQNRFYIMRSRYLIVTDGRMTCNLITALCIALRGKKL